MRFLLLLCSFAALASESVGPPPEITTQPQSQTVLAGSEVRFSVDANSVTFLTFQWQHNGRNVLLATESSFTIKSASQGNAGQWRCLVTNASGTTETTNATLTVWQERPRLEQLGYSTNGFLLQLSGEAGSYQLQTLEGDNWRELFSTNAPAGGFLFLDDSGASHRIYRAVGR